MDQSKNIYLIGFMGTGKTTVSKELHKLLGYHELDMDGEIEEREHMKIKDMFDAYGEEYFRTKETNLVMELEQKSGYIVSCGGGVVLRSENVASMKKGGVVILLTAEPKTIYERVHMSTNRPLLNGNMNVEYIAMLMEKRLPLTSITVPISTEIRKAR